MNYPEELREKYNEVMYYERDIIEKFLKDQYDIRYGRQRDTWHFEPAIEMIAHQGSHVLLHDMKLDKDKFVVFYVEAFCEKNAEWECFDFAYGELSKVIEALPDADDFARQNAIYDLTSMCQNFRVDLLLNRNGGFSCKIGGHNYIIDDVTTTDEELQLVHAGCADCSSEFPTELLTKLRDHINVEVLHCSNEYKELMELLSLQENLRFECHNFGDAEFTIDETDITLDVSAVQRDDKGNLVIYGADVDADEDITLTEKEIKPRYLTSIIECIKPKYTDIMDTYNAHNPELVHKINAAWKNPKYHERFGDILFAIGCRDKQEIQDKFDIVIDCNETAMDNAHEIMEGVCDDWDLETILSFIRYEE